MRRQQGGEMMTEQQEREIKKIGEWGILPKEFKDAKKN
jgi:hypothetical protein